MFGTLSLSSGDQSAEFTNNPYKARAGRTRHLACDRCRVAKVKCDGEKPSCKQCARWGNSCTYTTTRKPRKPRVKSQHHLTRDCIIFEGPPGSLGGQAGNGDAGKSAITSPRDCHVPSTPSIRSVARPDATVPGGDTVGSTENTFHLGFWNEHNDAEDFAHFDDDTLASLNSAFLDSGEELDAYFSGFVSSTSAGDGSMAGSMVDSPAWSLPICTVGDDAGTENALPWRERPLQPKEIESLEPNVEYEQHICTHQASSLASVDLGSSPVAGHHRVAPGQCNCLQQLTSSLFSLNNASSDSSTSSSTQNNLVNAINLDCFLALFKDLIEKWESVRKCASACFLRREFAVLLIMNVEQLAKMLLASLRVVHDEDGSQSHIAGPCEQRPSILPVCRSAINVGRFVVDDVADQALIVVQLLRMRIGQLDAFIKSIHSRLVHAGLGECCIKLGAIMLALGKAVRKVEGKHTEGRDDRREIKGGGIMLR
ncbi:hypothetical protein F4808DRAFT_381532 [Astrocystis sublimbata]|nr:hypothetical protein F4808DRAFT_381532 [Astrocystis sublimbata]